ncbi:uncharacterized protein A1O9_12869 [Exophiala aquamarina CBS 119918]|uniref:Uncharacterized protein n=1 Tax=Exophiala aquamarina CBS 119918 TaxID=1182545 RepID=A0A072NUM0_9EURO|nr:uncharacterized protein A1O9_12869 [Exophiala aquamarina CBS 119918]KEF51087.1 hypothetical protein A1O9_12869 [Exophiala aquamarina CBS 119918]
MQPNGDDRDNTSTVGLGGLTTRDCDEVSNLMLHLKHALASRLFDIPVVSVRNTYGRLLISMLAFLKQGGHPWRIVTWVKTLGADKSRGPLRPNLSAEKTNQLDHDMSPSGRTSTKIVEGLNRLHDRTENLAQMSGSYSIQIGEATFEGPANKTAIVTGGCSGIGLATIKLLASLNCNVIVGDLQGVPADDYALLSNRNVDYQECNILNWQSLIQLFETALKTFGKGIDFVIANAGVNEHGEQLLPPIGNAY